MTLARYLLGQLLRMLNRQLFNLFVSQSAPSTLAPK